jgi:hypothetical protein
MTQRWVPADINERSHGLDFAGRLPPFQIFAEVLGEAYGRGLFLGVVPGVLAMAFGGARYAPYGYLWFVPGGLFFMAVATAMLRVPVSGLPLFRWRRVGAIAASTTVPVAFIWLAVPVQHWARVRPSVTEKALASVAFLIFAVVLTEFCNRIFTTFRVSGPADDLARLHWLDVRIDYLQRLRGARWPFPVTLRTVNRSLGHDLLARFDRDGSAADVCKAADCFRRVQADTPPGVPDEAGALNDLVLALTTLAGLEDCEKWIDETIALNEAIAARWSERLSKLEHDFITRMRHELVLLKYIDRTRYRLESLGPDDMEAMAHAVNELARMAVDSDQPAWMRAQILVQIAQQAGFSRVPTVGPDDALTRLNLGLEVALAAASVTEDPWLAAQARAIIAQLAARRYRLYSHLPAPPPGFEDDHVKALQYIKSTLNDENLGQRRVREQYPVGLARVLRAVDLCLDVELGRRHWLAACQLGRQAVPAMNSVLGQALFLADIEEVASVIAGIFHKLGYAQAMLAIDDRDEERRGAALLDVADLFDHSRAVLHHLRLSLADFEDQATALAAKGHARLAAQMRELAARARAVQAKQLTAYEVTGKAARSLDVQPGGIPLRDEIRSQQAEFTKLAERIAALSGPSDGQAALKGLLAATAAAGPLCYLAHISSGDDGLGPDLPGLAIIVIAGPPESVTVSAVMLPELTGKTARRWLTLWPPPDPDAPKASTDRLLRELGTVLLAPVLEAAGRPGRLVLLPDGLLSILPLHAAEVTSGPPGPAASPVIRQHVVVAYAPSARILRASQLRAARTAGAGDEHDRLPERFLGIDYPGGDPTSLKYARQEVTEAASFFPEYAFLHGDEASPPRVRRLLLAADNAGAPTVVHFACHAETVPGDPLSSNLVLAPGGAQGRLRLADLLDLGLRHIRLAALSACETGQRGSRDPAQYVSLATGFLQIGAAGVIGTTTKVNDKLAQTLMTRFYREWTLQPQDPAAALARAQASLSADGRPSWAWAPFFYAGA